MTTILAFIFVLGVLVFFHESGHFLTAKWIGVKVNVFSLGFPPKLIGRRWGDTEYRIGLLPLGGYVKMAGDNPLEATGNPEEFMSRSKWERMAILFMGPLMNLVLGIGLLTVLFMVGLERPAGLDDPAVVRYVSEDSPAGRAEIEPGDQILQVKGEPIENWRQALDIFMVNANESLPMVLERGGVRIERTIEVEARGAEEIGFTGLFPPVQPQIASLMEDFPAVEAGLKVGDIITRVDGTPIFHYTKLIEAIAAKSGDPMVLEVLRDEHNLEITVAPRAEGDRWLIGIQFNTAPLVMERHPNPFDALGAAVNESVRFTQLTFTVIGRMLTGRASVRQMSGPIDIAIVSGEAARRGARELFFFMAILSLNLGILNLRPIPLLDGGHMAILSLEGLAGKDFSLQAKERILQVGFVMLLLLMVTVIFSDISKNVSLESIQRLLPW